MDCPFSDNFPVPEKQGGSGFSLIWKFTGKCASGHAFDAPPEARAAPAEEV
jgi:hypothetical protein